jgi:hypothetical protein
MRWNAKADIALAFQRIAIFLIAIFGFCLPLYYSTILLLIRFGAIQLYDVRQFSFWVNVVSAMIGFTAAFLPEIKEYIKLTG